MSFDVDAEGAVWILDQVNGRILRQKRGTAPFVFPVDLRGAQDLLVLPSGEIAVLDRLGDRRVDLFAPNGTRITSLPLEGKNLREGGAVTGLFAKGEELYAERAHGPLVHIGNRSGESRDRHELLGRPGPGDLLVSAGISNALQGSVYVVLVDHFTQSVSFGAPLSRIASVFVGHDELIYVAAAIKEEVELVRVLCLDLKGTLVGKIDLPDSPLADESFRDLTPGPDGGVVYAYRDEAGVSYFLHQCR